MSHNYEKCVKMNGSSIVLAVANSVFHRGQMVGTSVLAALAGHLFCKA